MNQLPQGFQRVHPISPFLRVGIWLLLGAIAVVRQMGDTNPLGVAVLAVIVVLAGLVYGFLAWWFTRFRVDPEELRIDSGVLVRRSRRLSIDRLQAVDVVQPFLARLFGMAELRFEVAGGSESEAPLAYLRLDEARRLRGVILDLAEETQDSEPATAAAGIAAEGEQRGADGAERSAVEEERGVGGEQPGAETPAPEPTAVRRTDRVDEERVVIAVPPQWLVKGALLSTEFVVSMLILVVGLLALLVVALVVEPGMAVALAAPFGLPVALSVGAAVMRHLITQWGFVLSDTRQGWRLRRGLFDLRSQTVPLDRVQGFAVFEPWLWRRAGLVRVEVDVAGYAGSSDSGANASPTLLPAVPKHIAYDVLARLGHGDRLHETETTGVPRGARWFRPVGWSSLAVGVSDRVVLTVRGWMLRRTDIVPHHKTQSVHLKQGPLQRRLGLADVYVHTTPGPCHAVAKHRPQDEGRALLGAQLERARRAREFTG